MLLNKNYYHTFINLAPLAAKDARFRVFGIFAFADEITMLLEPVKHIVRYFSILV